MFEKWYLIVFIFYVYEFCDILCANTEYTKCKTNKLWDCPANSECAQLESYNGKCVCIKNNNYEFNPDYRANGSMDYCRLIENINATLSDGHKPNETSSRQSYRTPPATHHILGGIFIPIFSVLLIIGAIFAFKKYNVWQRTRDVLFTRRRRPAYEDVMLGNDSDDPPLI